MTEGLSSHGRRLVSMPGMSLASFMPTSVSAAFRLMPSRSEAAM